jgi:small-conductance mechanosensitive channel
MNKKMKNMIIFISGPLATLFLFYIAGGNGNEKFGIYLIVIPILIGIVISVVVVVILQKVFKKLSHKIILSVVLSELCYIIILLLSIWIGNQKGRTESLMWLPIMVVLLLLSTLPMAISVSYGTTKFIEET